MDAKLNAYGIIITDWLNDFVQIRKNFPNATYELVTDDMHHHYQVIRTGWNEDRFYYKTVFHLQIKPTGKVWLLVNNTDLLVFDELVERGIPKSDLVIGFLPESMRAYSGFAVA